MDLELIKHFIVVARLQNITRAAETLFLSQPALSRRISALENDLGVKLLIRNTHNVELTEAGVTLYEQGQELLKQADELRRNVLLTHSGRSGRVTLATERIMSHRLMHFFMGFDQTLPELELTVNTLYFSALMEMLLSGAADVGIVRSYELDLLGSVDRFHVVPLLHTHLCFLLTPDHPLADRGHVAAAELAGQPVSVFSHLIQGNCRLINQLLDSTGLRVLYPLPETHEDVLYQIRVKNSFGMIERGDDMTMQQGLALLELEDHCPEFDFVLLWDKKNTNPALPPFLKAITEYMATE